MSQSRATIGIQIGIRRRSGNERSGAVFLSRDRYRR